MKKSSTAVWLNSMSKKQRGMIWLVCVLNVLLSALSIAFALAIKVIIDGATDVNKQGGYKRLVFGAIAISAIILLQFILRISINLLSEKAKYKLEMAFKSHIFASILDKKYEKISIYHSGEMMTRLTSDVAIVAEGITYIAPEAVASIAKLVCAFVAILLLDWFFALLFVGAGLLVFVVVTLVRGKLKSLHKSTQETDGRVRSFLQECIENLLAVKVFGVNNQINSTATDLQEKNYSVKIKRRNISVLGNAAYNVVFSLGYIFALIYGGFKIFNGLLGWGTLSALLQLVLNIQAPLGSLSTIVPKYYATLASAERLIEIENIENEPNVSAFNAQGAYEKMSGIVFNGVNFSYGREQVFKEFIECFEKGKMIVISGSSGAGKSTLIKLLLGVYEPNGGEIYAQTENEKIAINNSTRSLFSYVPQGNMLFSGTLYDNITFIKRDAKKEEIDKALWVSCLDELVNSLPQGLDTVVGENGVGLSEGQIQRVAIARAVIANAPIMLLDEATSALDENTERRVLNNLKGLKGVTIIIVSHKKAALEICDKQVVIKG